MRLKTVQVKLLMVYLLKTSMNKIQLANKLQHLSVEDAYVRRILKRAVRRLRCKGIRLAFRNAKESLLNIEL
jgi:hypothetical protein